MNVSPALLLPIIMLLFWHVRPHDAQLECVEIADIKLAASSMMCPGAGPDTMICGFEYELQGSEVGGRWHLVCSESDGVVYFTSPDADTTGVKVEHCGDYMFVYTVDAGPCAGTDTVEVFFESPDSSRYNYDLEILLELDVECHMEPTDVVCDNVITIDGVEPPSLLWTFCGSLDCITYQYETERGQFIDSCEVDTMTCLETIYTDTLSSCESAADLGGVDVVEYISKVLDLDGSCPLPIKCQVVPPECIDTVVTIGVLEIPILEGGMWHYLNEAGDTLPLADTSYIPIDGRLYVFIVDPDAMYGGPGDVTFTVWEVLANDAWVQPSVEVRVTVLWLFSYIYEFVELRDTNYIIKDSCDFFPCGGLTIRGADIDIPDPPDNPCGSLDLVFGATSDDINYILEIDCNNPFEFMEICPGQVEVFDFPGFFTFNCINSSGCPYTAFVEVFDFFQTPTIGPVTTGCDPGNTSFSATFTVEGGSGPVDIDGFGTFAYNEVITISGLESCFEYEISATDPFSGCTDSENVIMCCCTEDQVQLEVFMCEGETYNFNGQILSTTGVYEQLLVNNDGCDSVVTLDLTFMEIPERTMEIIICEGEEFDFYGTILSNAGQYQHSPMAPGPCDSLVTLNLDVASGSTTSVEAGLCEGDVYDFHGQQITAPGMYSAILQTSNGCDSIIDLTVSVSAIDFDTHTGNACEGETNGVISVAAPSGGQPPYVYALDDNDFEPTGVFKGLRAGSYTVTVKDAHDCESEQEAVIDEIPVIESNIAQEYTLCGDIAITIDVYQQGVDPDSVIYTWSTGASGPVQDFDAPGEYSVTITTPCESSGFQFTIIEHPDNLGNRIFVPNVFSPNDDGVNDVFKVSSSVRLDYFELHLYDRWGDELREMRDVEEVWDGTFLGEMMNPGVYVWWLKARGENCDGSIEEVLLKGDVTIVR